MDEKAKQESSLIGRIFCLEAVILLMGLASITSWFFTSEVTQLFFGVLIVLGSIALHFVRKKDWKKHWEEQELIRQALEKERLREKERKDGKA